MKTAVGTETLDSGDLLELLKAAFDGLSKYRKELRYLDRRSRVADREARAVQQRISGFVNSHLKGGKR